MGPGETAPANAKGNEDWGIAPPSSGLSRETKLGFAFVLVLLVVFGFVVYKKIERNRADRGELLAGVQNEGEESKEQVTPVAPTNTAQNPFAENSGPPQQTGDPFPESEPLEPTPANWENQTFQPTPVQQTTSTSVNQFPPGPPEEFGSQGGTANSQPFPAEQQQPTYANQSNSQTVSQAEEFNPTPFPETEVTQAQVPQEFEPPAEFGNSTQVQTQQSTASQTKAGESDPGFNPFGDTGATTVEAQPAQVPPGFEEQFSTQSQPQNVAQTQAAPSPSEQNPFGADSQAQTAQPFNQDMPTAQAVPQPTADDPFSSAPSEIVTSNSVPMPAQNSVENDPRFGDFQPAPSNQYEANPHGVPNELPSDVFAQVSSSQIATVGTTGYGQMQPTDRPDVYAVRPGDNYWNISKKQYGTVRYFMALARYNQPRIPDPNKMLPGMKVMTPTRDLLESRNPDLFPKFAANTTGIHNVAHQGGNKAGFYLDANGTPMYRVGPDDTLGGIAQKHLGRFSRWEEIYQMNQHRLKNPDALTLGDVLVLPADASRVSMVRHASGIR